MIVQPARAPLFDLVVVVDWSANSTSKTGRDSIWIAAVGTHDLTEFSLVNPSTRAAAEQHLAHLIADAAGSRVLVGCDFSFGYPAGFARAIGHTGDAPWATIWAHLADELVDEPDNSNNRFAVASRLNASISTGPGPFWGTTAAAYISPTLRRTKAPGFPHATRHPDRPALQEFRVVEQVLRASGLRPSSSWQLAGAGCVGSQALTGIAMLARLRRRADIAERQIVWPFETGLSVDRIAASPDSVVLAEVWPSLVPLDLTTHDVRDAAQVSGLAAWLAALDRRGDLAELFSPATNPADTAVVMGEEGWVLGVR
ncbi:MAG: cobalamin biosynthesis protein CbiG [Actinomycetota bacterium]